MSETPPNSSGAEAKLARQVFARLARGTRQATPAEEELDTAPRRPPPPVPQAPRGAEPLEELELDGELAPVELAALFAQGCLLELGEQAEEDRPSFLRLLAADLGQLEQPPPRETYAALRERLSGADTLLLADALAGDLARRANELWRCPVGGATWLLEQLLGTAGEEGGAGSLGRHQELVRRAEALLQEGGDRWPVLHRLLERCDNVRLLRYLCSSPELFGPDALAVRLLAQGSSRHVSCALYALRVAPGRALAVSSALLDQLDEQETRSVCSRVLDLYAQLWLTQGEPELLRAALLRWLEAKICAGAGSLAGGPEPDDGEGWLRALIEALAGDSRLLRQVFLIADLAELLRDHSPHQAALLHHEVLRLFLADFTPAGARHPLADARWQSRLGDALAEAMDSYPELASRLEQFGLGLPQAASRWLESQEAVGLLAPGQQLQSAELAAHFLRLFGGTLLQAARALWQRRPHSAPALAAYRILARVLAAHRLLAAGAGTFGALEHLEPAAAGGELDEELLATAATIDVRGQQHRRQGRSVTPWLPLTMRREAGAVETTAAPAAAAPGDEGRWDGSSTWARQLRRVPRWPRLRALLGLDALLLLLLGLPALLLGLGRTGELSLEGEQLVLRAALRLFGLSFRRREQRLPLEGLRVELRRLPPAHAVRLVGWTVLAAGAVLGTVLLYAGLEAEQIGRVAQGAAALLGALLYDASCHHRYRQGAEEGLLLLTPVGLAGPVIVQLERPALEAVAARLGG